MKLICFCLVLYQESLKQHRRIDDNIAHALNTTIPTQSFAVKGVDPTLNCSNLYEQLKSAHNTREGAIKQCIVKASGRVKCLIAQREKDEDNIQVNKELRRAQKTLRLMQNELNVEEVVRDRTSKVTFSFIILNFSF